MTHCTTPAIILRRRSYGDYDLILTVLTRDCGKQTLIAKSAKKSTRRFAGILEPFAGLDIVFRLGRSKGMPVLEEAVLTRTFDPLRSDILKTAYASYWVELIALWLEEKLERSDVYHLLVFALTSLSEDRMPAAMLNILFQMRFIGQEGLKPVLEHCACCQKDIHSLAQQQFCIDLKKGGIVCDHCPSQAPNRLHLAKGTLMQLQWMVNGSLAKAQRVRLGPKALAEAARFLEAFVPYHIGRSPKSLSFLQQIRQIGNG
jgi:DNA repair protein RecO (recombination protein O)